MEFSPSMVGSARIKPSAEVIFNCHINLFSLSALRLPHPMFATRIMSGHVQVFHVIARLHRRMEQWISRGKSKMLHPLLQPVEPSQLASDLRHQLLGLLGGEVIGSH